MPLCLLCLFLMCLAALLLWPHSKKVTAGQRARDASAGLSRYDYELIFRPAESTLAVTMTLDYHNDTGHELQSLCVRLWANAFSDEAASPAALDEWYDVCYPKGFSAGGFTLQGIWWNDAAVTCAPEVQDPTVLNIPIPPLQPGENGTLLLRGVLSLPLCAHRFGQTAYGVQMLHALPTLSFYQDGAWRTDSCSALGDPFISGCANYTVHLKAPSDWQLICGGRCDKTVNSDGTVTYTAQLLAARDFSFVLSRDLVAASGQADGIQVTAWAREKAAAQRAVQNAVKALRTYTALWGDYPYGQLVLCEGALPFSAEPGTAFTLIDHAHFASDRAESLELVIAHETAHQWFGVMVASDSVRQPWQDEAVAEYAMLRYTLKNSGAAARRNLVTLRVDAPMREYIPLPVTPASPIGYFGSYDVYSAVVTGRGCACLLAMETLAGDLTPFLRAYADAFAFGYAARADFESLLLSVTHTDLAPLMTDYLDTQMN